MGVWGAGPGCYIVLPVLGPTTVRDTLGSVVNLIGGDAWYNVTVVNDTQYFSEADYYISRILDGIDFRAKKPPYGSASGSVEFLRVKFLRVFHNFQGSIQQLSLIHI